MRVLISFPILAILVVFQSAVVSRVSLLSGHADIVLVFLAILGMHERAFIWHWAVLAGLIVGFVSGLPWLLFLLGYLLVATWAWLLRRRIWDTPLLATFSVVFLGTLIMNIMTFVFLRLAGSPLEFSDVLSQIVLPSLLLNLLAAVLLYPLARDLAGWVYPAQEIA